MIRNATLSPTGTRQAFEARGEIFSVPTEKGDFRNLTQSSGAHDRSPVWAPDGAHIAWLSDASGEYQLMVGDPLGITPARTIALPSTAFFSNTSWSPDGTHIVLEDNHDNLWAIDIASGSSAKIDNDDHPDPIRQFNASWSPDSKWITYSKNLPSHLRAVFVYSWADKKSYQITDGLADSISPTFDASGKYLYFMASTNFGPSTSWLEMSSLDRPVRRAIYLVVLSTNEPSPLLPETGDEPKAAEPSTPQPKPDPNAKPTVRIDPNGISQRILAVNLPVGDYSNLSAGAAGTFYYTEPLPEECPASCAQRYQWRSELRRLSLKEQCRSYSISADKKKLLYQAGPDRWGVVGTDRPAKVGDGPLNVAQLEMRVDPREEGHRYIVKHGELSGSISTTQKCTAMIGKPFTTNTNHCSLMWAIALTWDT
jgi:tricorn protease